MTPKELEALVFSGDYERVIALTAAGTPPEALPALVGALALSGRLDEAESAFRSLESGRPAEGDVVQARFFVIAGLCHAGMVPKALRRARQGLSDRRQTDARTRFWVWQGLALVRFFQGRFDRARRFARRALAAAVEAAFPYARLLALDLLAHVLLYTGDIHAGMRMLGQAAALAEALGYEANRCTLETARAVFQLRFGLAPLEDAVAEARAALAQPSVSFFTRRNGLLELAMALALSGEGARAREALEEARTIALLGSDRRGKTRSSIADALVTALSRGREAAQPLVDDAWSASGEQLTLAAEIGFVDVFFVGPTERAQRELPAVASASGVTRARLAAAVLRGEAPPSAAQLEDRLCRVLVACHGTEPAARLETVLTAELLGLVPWALRIAPGRRIVVTPSRVISEDHGVVSVRPTPGGPSLRLLSALRDGYQSRETLVSSVWGLGRYDPHRHSAVINTAVSRLRLALATPAWILTHEGGYELEAGVEILELTAPAVPAPAVVVKPASDEARALSWIEANGPTTTGDLARALGVSSSSALRVLRRLERDGAVVREGRGRATRYALA